MNKPFSWFCKIFIAPILKKLLIKEIRGKENIPKRNFILASNHESHLDQVANGVVCVPRRFHFIGQVDTYTGLQGLIRDFLYFISGVVKLDRTSQKSKKIVLKKAIQLLKKDHCLVIYPEGTRSRTGEMGKGKWGIAKMVIQAEVPVLPVGIEGTFELMPPGGKLKIEKRIRINIGKPLYFEKEIEKAKRLDGSSEEYKKILHEITEKIMQTIKKLKEEI